MDVILPLAIYVGTLALGIHIVCPKKGFIAIGASDF
jgi:hypothetical protein